METTTLLAAFCFVCLHTDFSAASVVQVNAGYDEPCTTSDDCTTDDNTYCKPDMISTCTKGHCACLDYMAWDAGSSTCKVKKYFQDRCNDTLTMCQGDTICVANAIGLKTCACAENYVYNGKLEMCVTSTNSPGAVGESCTDVTTDCYEEIADSVECSGSVGAKTCQCATGYVADENVCRKPHLGEGCTASVGCTESLNIPDASIVAGECSSEASVCVCPSDSTSADLEVDGAAYSLCLNAYSGDALANGATCTASNECNSKICAQCPGESGLACVRSD